ncbi:MAG: hypothetical protein GX434_02290 [Peptococcaceae bacterium]|nr:hypothetical protein [Peptococcaceae bacterium]
MDDKAIDCGERLFRSSGRASAAVPWMAMSGSPWMAQFAESGYTLRRPALIKGTMAITHFKKSLFIR